MAKSILCVTPDNMLICMCVCVFVCSSLCRKCLPVVLLLQAPLQQLFYSANCVAANVGFDMTMLPLTLPLLPLTMVIKYFSSVASFSDSANVSFWVSFLFLPHHLFLFCYIITVIWYAVVVIHTSYLNGSVEEERCLV